MGTALALDESLLCGSQPDRRTTFSTREGTGRVWYPGDTHFFRGILVGTLFSLPFWALLVWFVF
jgi:hypothetical protein